MLSFWENAPDLFKDGFILYGIGDGAEKVLAALSQNGVGTDKIHCVCVSDGLSVGTAKDRFFCGHSVKPLSAALSESPAGIPVVVCFGTHLQNVIDDITLLCESRDVYLPDVPVVAEIAEVTKVAEAGEIMPAEQTGAVENTERRAIKLFDSQYVRDRQKELLKLKESLADDLSRQVFENWLQYRLDGRWQSALKLHDTDFNLFSIPERPVVQTGTGFIRITDTGESYIDVGGYDGAGVMDFLKASGGEFSRICVFEPDPSSALKLRRNLYYKLKAPECVIQVAAAWDTDCEIPFRGGSGRGSRALYEAELPAVNRPARASKQTTVQAKKIDSVCEKYGISPTFIKIDAEGAERRILRGAADVVKKHRPRVAVAAYHRFDDILRIPETMRELGRYKTFLRSGAGVPPWEVWYYFV
ncbi:hypothetical protein FACS1894120_6080 [Clostridia bacterium]|nr:hypothetical protein FACS1894120_6080 [Clostridia bacterium]